MDSILEQKSFQFAIRIVNLCKHLRSTKKEYTLSKQLLRSGTSIGANVAEAQQAQSKADFISKLSIALKETTESKYWIKLIWATGYLSEKEYSSIVSDCIELEKILVTSVKTSKDN
ncbi:MAG: four helix bundle protein [Oscillospiraceae bacterium]|nr:four helix bundle protein [Oscillospiraceae bacterium]